MNDRSQRLSFLFAAIVLVLSVAGLAAIGPWRSSPLACLALFGVAGAAWLAAVATAESARVAIPLVCGVALVLRVFALSSSLTLSDDVYRYVFEGELSLRGISPYAFGAGDPELESVRAELPTLAARVAHPEVPAVYPPLVQFMTALAVRVSHALGVPSEIGAVWCLRVLLGLADLAVLCPLAWLARRVGRVRGALVAWGFCPLVVFEFAGSAHFDAVGIALFCGALVALAAADRRRSLGLELGASALFAAAVLSKYLPLLSLPWLGVGRTRVTRALVSAACIALAFVPFLFFVGGERGFTGGLHHYGDRWEAGSLVFRFIRDGVRVCFGRSVDPERVARIVVALVWLGFAAIVYLRVRERVRGAGLLIAAFLVLTPTLHPWYLTWMLPFVALYPTPAWLWLIAAAPVLYAPLRTWQEEARWVEPVWVWPVLALPFFALLLFARGRTASTSPRT